MESMAQMASMMSGEDDERAPAAALAPTQRTPMFLRPDGALPGHPEHRLFKATQSEYLSSSAATSSKASNMALSEDSEHKSVASSMKEPVVSGMVLACGALRSSAMLTVFIDRADSLKFKQASGTHAACHVRSMLRAAG